MPFFHIGMDSGCVFVHQLAKDEFLKHSKNQDRQQKIQNGALGWICNQSDAQDVKTRRTPHQTGQEQQGISFYFHR